MSDNNVYMDSIEKWSKNRGIGTISYDQSLNLFEPAKIVLNKYFAKNPNSKVIVIINNVSRKDEWATKLLSGFNFIDKLGNNTLRFITADHIIFNNITDKVELVIFDQIDRFMQGNRADLIRQKYIKFQFVLGLTHSAYPDGDNFVLSEFCPVINRITKADIVTHGLIDGIVEYNIPVEMDETSSSQYNDYNEFIKDTLGIFDNDFDLAIKCYSGDTKAGISADHFRNEFAEAKGWHKDLDLASEYYKSIDRYYNPNSLYERAKTLMAVIRERKNLLANNKLKLNAILDIIRAHSDKKVLIISKNYTFANEVCEAINKEVENSKLKKDVTVGTLFKPSESITGHGIRSNAQCVEYHPNLESRPLIDPETGDYIRVKSGNNKGKVKMFGAATLNKIANQRLNEDFHNVISSVNAIPKEAEFEIDFLIVTSPECNTFKQLQYRVARLNFKQNVKIVNIYLEGTKEVDKLQEKQSLTNNKVVKINSIKELSL